MRQSFALAGLRVPRPLVLCPVPAHALDVRVRILPKTIEKIRRRAWQSIAVRRPSPMTGRRFPGRAARPPRGSGRQSHSSPPGRWPPLSILRSSSACPTQCPTRRAVSRPPWRTETRQSRPTSAPSCTTAERRARQPTAGAQPLLRIPLPGDRSPARAAPARGFRRVVQPARHRQRFVRSWNRTLVAVV
jgi:hypothetical protein